MTDPYRILDPAGERGRQAGRPDYRVSAPAPGRSPGTVNGHSAGDANGSPPGATDPVNGSPPGATDPVDGRGMLRPVLWLLLVITVAANAVISSANLNLALGVASGLAALGCATALIVDHYRHRRG